MQGFASPLLFVKNPRWPTKMATNEHFRSGFRNGNNQNYFLDTFRIPNMYVKKIRSWGVGGVTFLLNYTKLQQLKQNPHPHWQPVELVKHRGDVFSFRAACNNPGSNCLKVLETCDQCIRQAIKKKVAVIQL